MHIGTRSHLRSIIRRTPLFEPLRQLRLIYRYKIIPTWFRGVRRYGFKVRGTIRLSPDSIERFHIIRRYMLLNRYRLARHGELADIEIYWAFGAEQVDSEYINTTAINARCLNTKKSYVDEVHREVFGYCLAVDPTTFSGAAFAKTDENATHDGQIVQLPIANPNPDRCYQILVDNIVDDVLRQDIRTVIVEDEIPVVTLVYRKQLLDGTIGGRESMRTEVRDPEEVFSIEEISKLIRFARAMGLDWGEFDVLRDKPTGRIFVVDVNRAVGGLPTPWETTDIGAYWRQLELAANAFDRAFLKSRI